MDKGLNNITCQIHLEPISETEFNKIFSPILKSNINQLAVAVSGGSDSLALSLLLHRWCSKVGVELIPLTVDHGLRVNSREDAQIVLSWMKSWGLDCRILRWDGKKPNAAIQEQARIARYKLMLDWCIKNGVQDLVLAHHQEDQAETFLMRLIRGSGKNGLGCMRRVTKRRGVRLLRPLLTVSKSRLQATLKLQDLKWLEDPANINPAYTRTQIRNLSAALVERELSTQRLAILATQFGQLREKLEDITRFAIKRVAKIDPMGWAFVDDRMLILLPEEIQNQVIKFLIKSIGGKHYSPRQIRLKRILKLIKTRDQFKAISLGGCSIRQSRQQLKILREEYSKTEATPIFTSGNVMWRNVFQCKFEGALDKKSKAPTLTPLGHKGWVQLINERPEIKNSSVPYRAALTLPALFYNHVLESVPHLKYKRKNLNDLSDESRIQFVGVKFIPLEER